LVHLKLAEMSRIASEGESVLDTFVRADDLLVALNGRNNSWGDAEEPP
jgi:hypothetical protein